MLLGFERTCEIAATGTGCAVVPLELTGETIPASPAEKPSADPRRSAENRQGSQTTRSGQAYSLRLENQPLGKVLAGLADQVGLEVVWDPALTRQTPDPRRQRVSCDVTQVPLHELVETLLPAEIELQIDGNRLLLSPRE